MNVWSGERSKPFIPSNVPYETAAKDNGPHSQEWHRSREATVHDASASIKAEVGLGCMDSLVSIYANSCKRRQWVA
jgi:hypothetical protein